MPERITLFFTQAGGTAKLCVFGKDANLPNNGNVEGSIVKSSGYTVEEFTSQ